jgi:hypothetical protein
MVWKAKKLIAVNLRVILTFPVLLYVHTKIRKIFILVRCIWNHVMFNVCILSVSLKSGMALYVVYKYYM